jgi:phage antirepressor YoqD-like protein
MTELAINGDRRMTTREVAAALRVSIETVRSNGKVLFPELFEKGRTASFNEAQTTAIKLRITGHHNLQSTLGVKNARTRLERNMIILEAMKILQEDNESLKAENAEQAERLLAAEPKADVLDKMTAGKGDVSVRDLAAILAVPHLGQNKLFERLRKDGYIDSLNRPYRQYVESGIMYEKEYYAPQLNATKLQLRIMQKGAAHFAKKYGGAPA